MRGLWRWALLAVDDRAPMSVNVILRRNAKASEIRTCDVGFSTVRDYTNETPRAS